MTLYFAVSEGLFEIAKILVNQHIRRGLGLNHFVKVKLMIQVMNLVLIM